MLYIINISTKKDQRV